jgi:hypothetical protein
MSDGEYRLAAKRAAEAAAEWVTAHEAYLLLLGQKASPDDRLKFQEKRSAARERARELQEAWREADNALAEQINAIGYPVD